MESTRGTGQVGTHCGCFLSGRGGWTELLPEGGWTGWWPCPRLLRARGFTTERFFPFTMSVGLSALAGAPLQSLDSLVHATIVEGTHTKQIIHPHRFQFPFTERIPPHTLLSLCYYCQHWVLQDCVGKVPAFAFRKILICMACSLVYSSAVSSLRPYPLYSF